MICNWFQWIFHTMLLSTVLFIFILFVLDCVVYFTASHFHPKCSTECSSFMRNAIYSLDGSKLYHHLMNQDQCLPVIHKETYPINNYSVTYSHIHSAGEFICMQSYFSIYIHESTENTYIDGICSDFVWVWVCNKILSPYKR